ncbi:MAG: SUMF1/EgtB/PvdO family nonheme iron enzyme [Deltaproteobacteria bacterium]|nr:SUMF1/EgtB/PvdO family nonheme iron enzyme [Deltaproteobacteria bacterium]
MGTQSPSGEAADADVGHAAGDANRAGEVATSDSAEAALVDAPRRTADAALTPDAFGDGATLDGPAVADGGPGGAGDSGSDGAATDDSAGVVDGMTATPCAVPGKGTGTCQPVATCPGTATAGFCPGPKDIQCCTPKAAAAQCDPEAKPQPNATMGAAPAGLGNCPAGMAKLTQGLTKPFCIDRWEAALEVETAAGWQPHSPYWNPAKEKVRAVARPGQVPQGYISGKQAEGACKAAGKRLCSDAEWLRACKGPNGTTYPYGPILQPKLCNDSRAVHPAVEYFGTGAAWIWSQLGHPCINQLPESVAKTGAFAGCASAEGLFDLVGNLHEWTSDPAGTFRGGFYVDTKLNGPGCLYATTAHDMGHWDYSTGFRCCADAP